MQFSVTPQDEEFLRESKKKIDRTHSETIRAALSLLRENENKKSICEKKCHKLEKEWQDVVISQHLPKNMVKIESTKINFKGETLECSHYIVEERINKNEINNEKVIQKIKEKFCDNGNNSIFLKRIYIFNTEEYSRLFAEMIVVPSSIHFLIWKNLEE